MDFIGGPCNTCGKTHTPEEMDARGFRPGVFVLVSAAGHRMHGYVGSFYSWTQYGCPLHVRLRFPREVHRDSDPTIRDTFDPCILRVLEYRRNT